MSKLNDLNALEEAEAEEAAGVSILAAFANESSPRTKILGALAWVHRKREEPTLTFTDYMKSVKFRDIQEYLFGDDDAEAEEDPFPESGEASPAADAGAAAGGEGAVLSGDGDPA